MVRKRPSTKALYSGAYNPTAAIAARFRKGVTGPKQAARLERRRQGPRVRRPNEKPGELGWKRYLPDTPEVAWLRKAAVEESVMSKGTSSEWGDELRAMGMKAWRAAYAGQERARRAAKPKAKSLWVRVRAYRRRRPHP